MGYKRKTNLMYFITLDYLTDTRKSVLYVGAHLLTTLYHRSKNKTFYETEQVNTTETFLVSLHLGHFDGSLLFQFPVPTSVE